MKYVCSRNCFRVILLQFLIDFPENIKNKGIGYGYKVCHMSIGSRYKLMYVAGSIAAGSSMRSANAREKKVSNYLKFMK